MCIYHDGCFKQSNTICGLSSCPKCEKDFTLPLLSLDFRTGKAKMVRSRPHGYSPLLSYEDKKITTTKIKAKREIIERNKEEQKAFFLFGETEFKGCKFKHGYLQSLPKNKPIPDECFGCPQLVEYFQSLKGIQ